MERRDITWVNYLGSLGFLVLGAFAISFWFAARNKTVLYRVFVATASLVFSRPAGRFLYIFCLPAGIGSLLFGIAFSLMIVFPESHSTRTDAASILVTSLMGVATACGAVSVIAGLTAQPKWLVPDMDRDLPAPWRGEAAEGRALARPSLQSGQAGVPISTESTGTSAAVLRVTRRMDAYINRFGRIRIMLDGVQVGALKRGESIDISTSIGREIRVQCFNGMLPSNTWIGSLRSGDSVHLLVGHEVPDYIFDTIGAEYSLALYEEQRFERRSIHHG